ncbi:MAG: acyltransferase [Candidatus Electrothrix sp. GM3_4]|nr:acyltransferase [Candidatus Electrothrix sp. GM3_4]
MASFYSENELVDIGFKCYGKNVCISKLCSIHNAKNISLGSNIRIDDFCVISAGEKGVKIGNYVHIAIFSSIIGAGEVVMDDFSCISSRVAIYSSNDDYSGEYLTNPLVPNNFRNVQNGDVYIGRHVVVGSGSVLLPNIKLEQGAAIGALSLVSKDCEEFSIYAGVPAVKIKNRKKNILDKEKQLFLP